MSQKPHGKHVLKSYKSDMCKCHTQCIKDENFILTSKKWIGAKSLSSPEDSITASGLCGNAYPGISFDFFS